MFTTKGFYSAGFLNFTPREALSECLQGAVLVDVREDFLTAYKQFDVPKSIFCPNSQIQNRINDIPKNVPLIIADSAGIRSRETMVKLTNEGYKNIANLAGGIVEWESDGLPLKINNKERLDGSCTCQLKPRHK